MQPCADARPSQRAITGIGTLIIFIALVLAAALAASVVLDTTSLLQNTADQTGADATNQVSERLKIVTVTGSLHANETLDTTRIVVTKNPGTSDINLANTAIELIGPSGEHHDPVTGTPLLEYGTGFTITPVNDDDTSVSDGILNDPADRARLVIDHPGDAEFHAGDTLHLTIITGSGATTSYYPTIPNSVTATNGSYVEL